VREAAQRLGYRPNLAARRLVTGRTGSVLMILGGVSAPIEHEPAQVASWHCHERGYDLHVVMHHNDQATLERVLGRLEQGVADGAIVLANGMKRERELLARLLDHGFPLVFLDRHVRGLAAATFTTANAQGSAELVRRCAAAGAGAVFSLFGEFNTVEVARRRGALEAIQELGMEVMEPASLGTRSIDKVGVIATDAGAIHDFVRTHHAEFGQRRLVFGCFDAWPGEPYPAEEAFVCEQDFSQMAARASSHLLDLIDGETENRAKVVTVPLKAVQHIVPRF
jgi:DNA-binding LacI/PurR family transcriptional regulator